MLDDEIRALEEQLLARTVRASRAQLERPLSDEFVEFSSSGRVYTKSDVIAALMADPDIKATATDFRVLALTPGVVLATYRTG